MIRAVVDSNGRLQTSFNLANVLGMATFKTYASGNIFKENYKFGYGIHIGQPEF
jgi:hypothetical protein